MDSGWSAGAVFDFHGVDDKIKSAWGKLGEVGEIFQSEFPCTVDEMVDFEVL